MYIIRAALMYSNGEVVEGRDYAHIAGLGQKLSFPDDYIKGFVTSTGDFVLPDEAADIALEAGQITEVNDKLIPDQLWPQGAVLE